MLRHAVLALLLPAACDTTLHPAGDAGVATDAMWSARCIEAQDHSDYAWLQANVFTPSCAAFSSCHQGGNPPGQLSLTAAAACGELTDQPAYQDPTWLRVAPGDPDHSWLMYKLGALGPVDPDAGALMPFQNDPLCGPKREAIRRWIEEGAACAPDAG